MSPFAEGKIELLIRNQPSVSEQSEAARMWNALREIGDCGVYFGLFTHLSSTLFSLIYFIINSVSPKVSRDRKRYARGHSPPQRHNNGYLPVRPALHVQNTPASYWNAETFNLSAPLYVLLEPSRPRQV